MEQEIKTEEAITRMTLRLPTELCRRLKAVGGKDQRSLHFIILRACEAYANFRESLK